jgi:filamentous hemagglutinin
MKNRKITSLVGSTLTLLAGAGAVSAAELPIPCIAGSCGPTAASFVSSGRATAVSTQDTLRVTQQTDRATFNWKSFNIGPDGKVIFDQPDASSIALNRIFQASPSKIFGALQANGQIYLINPNGILFGAGSQVNTAGLLASTLNMSDDVFKNGILAPSLLQNSKAVLEADNVHDHVRDDAGAYVLGPDGQKIEVEIRVEQGAKITTSGVGGRVLIASRTVTNSGSIQTPDGQTLLAAGEKVYLAPSNDPNLRGLLIEVDPTDLLQPDPDDPTKKNFAPGTGIASNTATGVISAPRGNTTLVGLAVNQSGRISATTTVAANGSVRLLARAQTDVNPNEGTITALKGGTLEVGSTSRIDILPELNDTATAVDDQAQLPSTVELAGQQVVLRGGSQITAPGGTVKVTALHIPKGGIAGGAYDAKSHIRVETGSVIDVSGSSVTLPASRNLVTVELRANELADSPLQRDSAVRSQTVTVDRRVGTKLADISGALRAIPKTVAERTSQGGTVSFDSEGDVVVADGASIDVSGGVINYDSGIVQTTQLMRVDGSLIDIGAADPNAKYVAVINPTNKVSYDRWGVSEIVRGPSVGHIEAAYTEGSDAGTVSFAAPNMVLNGTFLGTVTTGLYQRDPTTAPLGGQFLLGGSGFRDNPGPEGVDHRAPSVNLVATRPRIVIDSDADLSGPRTLDLATDFLTAGGFTRTHIQSNGVVMLADSNPLQLLPGSTLQIDARRIEVGSNITSPGGSILFNAVRTFDNTAAALPRTGIELLPNVTLDVRGLWTNDFVLPGDVTPFSPVYRDGGTIALTVRPSESLTNPSELILGDGVDLLATGGAWRQANGQIAGGRGGSISLLADRVTSAFEIGNNVGLEAFGVAGADGGSLSLAATRLELQANPTWANAQRIDPLAKVDDGGAGQEASDNDIRTAALVLGTSLFSDHGFSHFNLAATGQVMPADENADAFVVRDGSAFDLRVRTLQLGDEQRTRPSGGTVAGFSSVLLEPDIDRGPVDLTLRVAAVDSTQSEHRGRLVIESGTQFAADPGSSFTFSGDNGVFFDGQVVAASGKVTFATPGPTSDAFELGYLPGTRIELGSNAIVDTSGTALIAPSDRGLRIGSVLDGGSIRLLASRGTVNVQSGARLSVAGTSTALDLKLGDGNAPLSRKVVASSAGSLEMTSGLSIAFAGTLDAHAGVGETGTAHGGSLTVTLSRETSRGFSPRNGLLGDPFPDVPNVVRVLDSRLAQGGAAVGQALLTTDQIKSSGVDALNLEAQSSIELDPGVSLSLGRSLTLSSPAISLPAGGSVMLQAPYVAFGYALGSIAAPVTDVGGGQLDVRGDQIDLIGTTNLLRIGQATFTSSGDLRLRGTGTSDSVGALRTNGDLTLTAARIYPSTSTSFTLSATGGTNNTITLRQNGTTPGAPLSAAGALSVVADNIVQGGSLYAPFGTISLAANDSLTLLDGSVTSVSAAGMLIPYGRVEIGTDWLYTDGADQLQTGIPDRRVELTAPNIVTEKGSSIDLRGGGDLYAYEWAPGTGGHVDALDPTKSTGLYAIIPSLPGQFAPYDPGEFATSSLRPGDSIYLSGGGGVPAGTYALLPARYALLPGAYLVTAVNGTQDLQPNAAITLSDGSPVVSGYRTFAGTGIGDTRYSGFSVRPGSFGRQLAAYNDYKASTFFPARAQRLDLGSVTMPADAGSLGLSAGMHLDARGGVLTAAATGGKGSAIDVSATHLELTSSPSPTADGVVQLDTSVVKSWSPAQLLLGGRTSDGGKSIEVLADSVSFASSTDLALDEIVAVARENISIASGARVASRSATADKPAKLDADPVKVTLTGDGAAGAVALAVSDLSRIEVERTDDSLPQNPGHVTVASGGQLATRGSLMVDAPGGAALDGTLGGVGASWRLASQHIAFTDEPVNDGIAVTSALAGSLGKASSIALDSRGSIDFTSDLAFGSQSGATIDTLSLTAASLRTLGEGNDVSFNARSILLAGHAAADAQPDNSSPGSGSLSLNAEDIQAGPGTLTVEGFASSALNSRGEIRTDGVSALRFAGALDLTAARITTTSGARSEISSDSKVRMLSAASPLATLPALGLGGSLAILGHDIEDSGSIMMPSGLVSLRAQSDLTIHAGAIVDVSGQKVSAAGREVGSPGGTISLAAGGNLTAEGGSAFALSGMDGEEAGRLYVQAGGAADLRSTFTGHSTDAAGGASFILNAGSLNDFAGLNSQLETGGFTRERSISVGSGDLVLGAGGTLTARSVKLSTDDGNVLIGGSIVALSDNERASIDLFGTGGVTLQSGSQLRAEGVGADGRGGIVTLGTTTGGSLSLLAGSRISTGGQAANGRVLLRAPALGKDVTGTGTDNDDIAIAAIASTFDGVSGVYLEPVLSFDAPASVTGTELSGFRDSVDLYAASAIGNITARLGALNGLLYILPGIELRREGDIEIGGIDLSNWRFGDNPGALTVRATGSVNIIGNISDGFTGNAQRVNLTPTRSATLRFTAGARLASADTSAVMLDAPADLTIGNDSGSAIVRTGTGNLELTAARDLRFLGASSGAYTGGLAGALTEQPNNNQRQIVFATDGGQLSLHAGRDLVGNPVTQAIGNWEIRGGRDSTQQTRWGTRPAQFKWNAGTLGGGDIDIRAGRDVLDLSVAAADSAIELVPDTLTQFKGGVLDIDAGRDISSAYVHATHGVNRLHAEGSFTRSTSRPVVDGVGDGSLFSFQDAQIALSARGDIAIETVIHPTMLSQPGAAAQLTSFFITYTDKSALSAQSLSGDVVLNPSASRLADFVGTLPDDQRFPWYAMLPPNTSLRSLSRDVVVAGDIDPGAHITVAPADHGQVDIFAGRDLLLDSTIIESDAPASILPTPLNPKTQPNTPFDIATLSARRIDDFVASLITAGRDILAGSGGQNKIYLASAANIAAGRDIVNLALRGQNLHADDVTSISAGRDVRYDSENRLSAIELGGPGRLDILAGRDVDVGFSEGISTLGSILNPQLPTKTGADLTVLAGLSQSMDIATFAHDVVSKTPENQDRLTQYIEMETGKTYAKYEDAFAAFMSLDEQTQRPFILETFFRELVASGREANTDPKLGFTRGYAAIDALFPKSRRTSPDDPPSPYAGDIRLAFSRIYTLAGGNISLLAPGGLLNVGLSNPPPRLDLHRAPSQLGIVAQGPGDVRIFTNGSVLVNEARIFTLGGGDIAAWSTTGDIDAGRGAKSSVSAPPPRLTIDSQGNVNVEFGGAVSGSGIRTIITSPDAKPGNVDLIAPAGTVNSGDAGIGAAGNLNVAAAQVAGLDNIQVGGQSTGVPAETSSLGASLSGASAASSSATKAATSSVDDTGRKGAPAPLADTALGWLDVFVEGFGEESCKPNDAECLNRAHSRQQ